MVAVKICGLTRVGEALACAEAGARALGCVFYPKSPRYVSLEQARKIRSALPSEVACVGVYVDADFDFIMERVERCGIDRVQLHGRETPEEVERLQKAGVYVIKALFSNREPGFEESCRYPANAFLVECAGGPLPGGNAMAWDWGEARTIARKAPLIVAGGLDPENVARCIEQARPDAVDVSSGVEGQPGRKDLAKVRRFLEAVRSAPLVYRAQPPFAEP